MNHTLARMYNTHGYGEAAQREQVKVAHLSLFAKAAAAQGIDLTQLDPATQQALYAEFTQKVAEEGGEVPEDETPEHEEGETPAEEKSEQEEGDDDSEEKSDEGDSEEKKEAQAQFLAMREWNQKVAEADYLGRAMAHAFHNEDMKIKTAAARGAAPPKVASARPAPQRATKTASAKAATAFDVQAARHAVKVASAAGLDAREAAAKLEALLTLGAPEMGKTAGALGDYNQALNVRSLELLEASGYPVDWSQVL